MIIGGTVDLGISGQLVTDGAAGHVNLDFSGLDVDLNGKMIRLTITADNPLEVGGMSLYLGVGGLADHLRWTMFIQSGAVAALKPGEQTALTLQLSEVHSAGGAIALDVKGRPSVRAGFTHARLQASDDGNVPVTVTLHSAELVEPTIPGAYVSITFDDSHDDISLMAWPKMQQLRFVGTDYTIADRVDLPGFVTMADLQARAAQGWEIGGHCYASPVHSQSYAGVTEAAAAADLASLKSWLETNFPDDFGHTMAYPLGEFAETSDGTAVESLVAAAGFAAGRSTLSAPGSVSALQIESTPPPIPTRLYAASGISELTTGQRMPANMVAPGGLLDKLESEGGWAILVFHQVSEGAPSITTQVSKAGFDAIMDAIAARNITVVTVRDMLRRLADPAAYATAVSHEENADEAGFSNTTYSGGSTPCGVAFTAPPSGRVAIHMYAFFESNTGDSVFVSSAVRRGSGVGSGIAVLDATDTRSLTTQSRQASGMARFVDDLTPGDVYNAQIEFRTIAGTGDILNRTIMVVPLP